MATPVLFGPLAKDALVGVSFFYQIRATNFPTSYNATSLPVNLGVDTATGRIGGKITTAGTYSVTISATNVDGTDTDTLVITAIDGVVGDGENGITVFQAKWWADPTERYDYADMDAAGQPVAEFDVSSVGNTQLHPTAVSDKIERIGGAGQLQQFIWQSDFLLPVQTRFTAKVASIIMPGVKLGDVVVCGELLDSAGALLLIGASGTAPVPVFGSASNNGVAIYVFNGGGATIPALSRINFRVFSFPGG